MIALFLDEGIVAVHPDPLEGVAGVDLAVVLAVAGLPVRAAEPGGVPLGGRLPALARNLDDGAARGLERG